MLALGAVEPLGSLDRDHHGVGRDHAAGLASCDGLVTREDASLVGGGLSERRARVVEVGLDHAVVSSSELELNHVADICLDAFGEESDSAVRRANRDHMDLLGGGSTQESEKSCGSELHFGDLDGYFSDYFSDFV